MSSWKKKSFVRLFGERNTHTHFEDFTFIWMCKFVIFKLMQPLGKVLNKFS